MRKKIWSSDIVIAAIRKRVEKGQSIRYSTVMKEDKKLLSGARIHFGSWGKAVIAAGFQPTNTSKRKKTKSQRNERPPLPRENIIPILQKMIFHNELPNLVYAYQRKIPIYVRACEEYGSWGKALIEAGLSWEKILQHELPEPSMSRGISLDARVSQGSDTTWANFIGEDDPGFERFEEHNALTSLYDKLSLEKETAELFRRVLAGEDLEDEQYKQLASAIREHVEILKLIKTT